MAVGKGGRNKNEDSEEQGREGRLEGSGMKHGQSGSGVRPQRSLKAHTNQQDNWDQVSCLFTAPHQTTPPQEREGGNKGNKQKQNA